MEFQSVEEVTQKLGIPAQHPEDIKREVRRRLLEVHPDTLAGAGLPEDRAKSEEALLLTAALNFLNKPEHSTDIAPRETETELVKLVRDLVQANQGTESQSRQQEIASREREAQQALSQTSAARVQEVKSAGRTRLIGLGSISGLLSAVWLLPTSIQNNLILGSVLNPLNPSFRILWFCSLCTTAVFWLFFKWRTEEEALFQRTLNLNSTQNILFGSFLSAPQDLVRLLRNPRIEYTDAVPYIVRLLRGQRSEYTEALWQMESNWIYQWLIRRREIDPLADALLDPDPEWRERVADIVESRFFGNDKPLQYFNKAAFVSHIEAKSTQLKRDIARRKRRFLWPLFFWFFAKEPIEAEQAQNVAELILTRGEANGVVTKVDSHSLDERYTLTTSEDAQEPES